jgi:hypothetical protein
MLLDLKRRAYYGVSAALSMGADNLELLPMRGETIPGAAKFLSAGRGITMPEPGRITVPYWITTEAEGRKAVEELAGQKADMVKIWVDTRGGKYKKLTPEIYGAIIDEAHKRGLRVSAHIFDMEDAKGLMRAGLDAFAHGVRDTDIDDETVAIQRPNLILTPNMPDRGVKTDLNWLRAGMPAEIVDNLEKSNNDNPRAQAFFGIQARNLAKLNAAGVKITLGTDGPAVGCACRNGRHGCLRDDADAGHRGGDAQRCRVLETQRPGQPAGRQERGFHRARRQSARRHHQHAEDLIGGAARRAGGSLPAGAVKPGC